MTTAEIVAIGTELLLGEIQDTNTRTLAAALRGIGLDLYRTSIVGDNQRRIAEAISDALERCEVVITSGGLGPTVDDVTREGIAEAFDLELEFRPELWEQIEQRFAAFGRSPTENNRRQAMLPAGAIGIENPVGTAPAFIVERDDQCVIALPGVPAELEHLLNLEVLPYLRSRLKVPAVIKSRLLRTAGIGESWIDERIDDLERMTNPTVGLAAHPGRVDIRITAKAGTEMEADELLWGVEATIRQRLGDRVYGTDQQTLEGVVLELVRERDGSLAVVESGTGGALARGLAAVGEGFASGAEVEDGAAEAFATGAEPADAAAEAYAGGGESGSAAEPFAGGAELPPGATEQQLIDRLEHERRQRQAGAGLGLAVSQREDRVDVLVVYRSEGDDWTFERSYGGAPPNAASWAVSLALDQLRRRLMAGEQPSA